MNSRSLNINAQFVSQLEELAIEAGRAILAVKAEGFAVHEKSDLSPVTAADRNGEDIIVAGLEASFPGIPIIAEERCSEGRVPDIEGNDFFLVDALDGTREFVAGRGYYTVNIGYVKNGTPIAGVVFAPDQRRLFSATPEMAMAVELDGQLNMLERNQLKCRYMEKYQRIVASRSHGSPQTDDYINAHGDSKLISIGSSLKFCLLAEGLADLYPRFSPTMEWDTAAGDAILRAAGGITVDEQGEVLVYGKRDQPDRPDFMNPSFIAKAVNQCGVE